MFLYSFCRRKRSRLLLPTSQQIPKCHRRLWMGFFTPLSNDVDIDLLSLTPRKMEEILATCPPGKRFCVWMLVCVCLMIKRVWKMEYKVADIHSVAHTFERVRKEREKEKLPLYLNNERKLSSWISICAGEKRNKMWMRERRKKDFPDTSATSVISLNFFCLSS